MNKVKREHFVPQCYLRYFSKNEKLNVYDKEKSETRRKQSTKNVSVQKAFYDFTELELKIVQQKLSNVTNLQEIEQFFSTEIEPMLKECIETLANISFSDSEDEILMLDDDFRAMLALQLAYQFIRTSSFRDNLKFFDEDVRAFLHKNILLDKDYVAKIGSFFYKLQWTVVINTSNVPYYTSDNPLAIMDMNKGAVGPCFSDNMLILFPFTPRISVILSSIPQNIIPSSIVIQERASYIAIYLNAMQYLAATRELLSQDDFCDLEQVLRLVDMMQGKVDGYPAQRKIVEEIYIQCMRNLRVGSFDSLENNHTREQLLEVLSQMEFD